MADREGIDSKRERDQLNYRPRIEYTLPTINASEYTGTAEQNIRPGILAQPILTTVWDRAVTISDNLVELEEKLSDKLKNDKVPLSLAVKPLVIEAAKKYNYEVTDSIPFGLYKQVINSPDSYEKNIIVDTYENYHADVNGDINAELYTDVAEMKQDWDETIKFINKGLFAQLVPTEQLPVTTTKDDPSIPGIDKVEKSLINQLLEAKKAYDQSLRKLKDVYLTDPTGDSFYSLQQETSVNRLRLTKAERAVYSRTEVYNLVDSKMVDYDMLTTFINNAIDFSAYRGSTFDLLFSLLKQYPSGQSMENGLRRIQALIKLSVDGKNEGVTNTKQDLRGMTSLPNKKRLNSALLNGIHLRNGVFGEVHDVMDNFDGLPDNSVFNVFAGHIVDSVVYADKLYEDQSMDFHKVHALDGELRKGKLRSVIDKDSSREIYKIIDKLLAYGKSRGWPTQANLSQWLKAFTSNENLN